jgi:hypothetical protein
MISSRGISTVFAVLLTGLFAAPVFAHGKSTFPTTLSGYNETTQTINSPGGGSFVAKISKDESSIAYSLTYSDLPTNATQAHIHFGRPGLSGGVVLFLCTNGTPPANVPVPPTCPLTSGTVTGTLTASDVIAVPAQSIDAGAAGFAEMIKALRNGAAYANVHTTGHPSGEIRGPLGNAGDDEDDDD